MPAKSERQRRLMAAALAFRRGELKVSQVSERVRSIARSMSNKQLKDFARKPKRKNKKA